MIESMTGYGKAEYISETIVVKAELRSLNSKTLDLSLRIPSTLRNREMEIRNMMAEKIVRGKTDLLITAEWPRRDEKIINYDLARQYAASFMAFAKELKLSTDGILDAVLRLPEVLNGNKTECTDEEWKLISDIIQHALDDLNRFRQNEGAVLQAALQQHVTELETQLQHIEKFEELRLAQIRNRLHSQLKEWWPGEALDSNRFEQELIYYLEKIDFTEEKVRLRSHCQYFLENMNDSSAKGRRLQFISQEMGREINTLGAKAQHAEIQKHVVLMKDELEKIKEQLLNVL
jgi:uncharacterized protein (TIGR00255 family)